MTNLVSQYIKKGLHSLYYAFYVIIEGIFKVSHSWNPIISIAGIISLLVALPLINIIRLLFLCWMDLDIPVNTATIICIIIWTGLYWLTYHYYFPAYKNIEQKFQKDSMLSKIVFGMFAIAVICISPNNYNFVDGIYAFKGMGPHFPRQIFVYKREKIFIFNSRGDYNPEGVIMEFCSCIKKLNLTHKEIVDYLNVICLYLQEEEVTDYGDTIK